jgi:ATP synthase protein I
MSRLPEADHPNHLDRSVRLHRERRARWRKEGERPIGRNLAMIGSLGWLIVTPTLAGALIGHWLDHVTGRAVFWSATLIFLGIVAGGWMAWKRMHRA